MATRPDLVESLSAAVNERRKPRVMERRTSQRKEVLTGGRIIYGCGRREMYCVIIDVSDSGARLVPARLRNCPDKFSLIIAHQPARDCEVVWRDRESVGVKFT